MYSVLRTKFTWNWLTSRVERRHSLNDEYSDSAAHVSTEPSYLLCI